MSQYQDLPMDFADATLVVLAEEIETDTILTTDPARPVPFQTISPANRFRIP